MTPLCGADALRQRFGELTSCLHQYRELWEPRPFASAHTLLPWEHEYPEIHDWMRQLSAEEIDGIERAMRLPPLRIDLSPVPLFQSWWDELQGLCEIGALPQRSWDDVMPPGMSGKQLQWRIPARKWSQILAFGGAAMAAWPDGVGPLVDWCAGKGHLGRTMGFLCDRDVVAIEYQRPLCEHSEMMAARLGVRWYARNADALAADAWSSLGAGQGALALHACGVLTHALLREGVVRGVGAFAASPCCPHFVAGADGYPPMSQSAQEAALPLGDKALRLAIADEILAPPRERLARRREMAFRLGLDLLRREVSGEDVYHSAGNLPKGALKLPFATFCEEIATRLGWVLPAHWSPSSTEEQGWELMRQVRARGLVRALFRRPLEMWLVLDRALFLVEHGYDVTMGTFCPPDMTPRNLMFTAVK